MARRGVFVPIASDASALIRELKESKTEFRSFGSTAKQVGRTVQEAADRQVRATVALDAKLRSQVSAYRAIAAAAKKGSQEQIAAANLAAKAQERLAHSLSVTEKEQRSLERQSKTLGRSLRGGLAGSGALAGAGRSIGFASSGFLAGFGISSLFRSVTQAASTVQEETEKTDVLFGESAKEVQAWSKTLAEAFGVSQAQALQASGVFGNMFRSLHFGQGDAAKMSQRLVELAADMASFNNASPEDTLRALSSGLAGQVRPLRQFGVFLSQDRIKQEALTAGIARNASHLTAAQKVQASYNIILRDTALQQGDVARNTESLSVAESKRRAALQNDAAIIGKALLPAQVELNNALAKNLGSQESQKNVQTAASGTAKLLTGAIFGLNKIVQASRFQWDLLAESVRKNAIFLSLFHKEAAKGVPGVTGPVGTATQGFQGVPGLSGPLGTPGARGPRASLGFQLSLNDERQAKAQLTRSQADDRAALVARKDLLNRKIAATKDLAKRTALLRDLGSTENQIQAIDDAAAQKQRDRQRVALEKQRKANEAAKKAREKLARERRKGIAEALADTRKAAEQAERQRDTIRSAIEDARQSFGELFTGAFLNPTDAQRKQALGAPNPAANAKSLVADLRSQIKAFTAFQHDLATLGKRGASPELLAELRAQGLSAAPQVHALATAGKGTLGQFNKLFAQKEALVAKTAKATIAANRVELKAERLVINQVAGKNLFKPTVYVYVDGHVRKARVKVTSTGQTRGASPGARTEGGV